MKIEYPLKNIPVRPSMRQSENANNENQTRVRYEEDAWKQKRGAPLKDRNSWEYMTNSASLAG